MNSIQLTQAQQEAHDALVQFVTDPEEQVFVLEGYSGTGKSTLVKYFLNTIDNINKTASLVNPEHKEKEIVLTATTNKAAENLEFISGKPVRTIHSYLGLVVKRDWGRNTSKLVWKDQKIVEDKIIFIDESSYIDSALLRQIFSKTNNCKIIFVGDPAQLLTVGSQKAPVFLAGFPTVALTEVVRQAKGNPIVELSTKFRNTVNTGEFFSFLPDGEHIIRLDREDFDKAILAEFSSPGWNFHQSKVLAWRNACVTSYNQAISHAVKGRPYLSKGDYAICNSFTSRVDHSVKTDQMVHITNVSGPEIRAGVAGRMYTIDGKAKYFGPDCIKERDAALNKAIKEKNTYLAREIDLEWIDLRPAYACTINKAQGSTFDKVFIDLDDISACRNANQIARMLYVAVSRARDKVYLTGDLV